MVAVTPMVPGEPDLCLHGASGEWSRFAHIRRAGRACDAGGGTDSGTDRMRTARLTVCERRHHAYQGAAHADDCQLARAHLSNVARMSAENRR
jgi:hypothetical protein